jgi:hypothetical protein
MAQVPVLRGPEIQRDALRTPMQGNIDVSSGTQALARGLGQVAEVVDAKVRRDAEAEANSLDAQITGEWNQWNAEARRRYQGVNAKDYEPEATKWWDEVGKRTGNVSALAQRRLQDVMQRRRVDALGGVVNYANGEIERHADQAAEAASTAAAEMGIDSGNVAGARQDILKITAQQGARKGWDADQIKVEQQRRVGSMHLSYFTKLVEVDAEKARAYYETNKDEIPLAAQGNVEKVLKGEGDNQFATQFAAERAGMPLAEQIKAAGEIKDPERRAKTLQQVKLNHALVKEAQAEREAAASDTAWQLFSQGRRIPELTLSQMNGKERAQLQEAQRAKADRLAAGAKPPKTDMGTYIDLRERLARGEQVNLRGFTEKIAPADMEKLLDIQTTSSKPGERDALYTTQQRTEQALIGLGIDAKKKPEEAKGFMDVIDQRIRAASAAKGKKLNPDEEQAIIDGVTLDKVYVDEWGTDPEKPVALLKRDPSKKIDEMKDAYVKVDGKRVMLSSIPDDDRKQIIAARRQQGLPVTEQAIAEYYIRRQKQPPAEKPSVVSQIPQ